GRIEPIEVVLMREVAARVGGLGGTLRRRWWVLPIVLVLVAAGLVLRALTAPLAVSASVADGDRAVVRSSAVVLTFSQDMDIASVKHGFQITPSVPYAVVVKNRRTFPFHSVIAGPIPCWCRKPRPIACRTRRWPIGSSVSPPWCRCRPPARPPASVVRGRRSSFRSRTAPRARSVPRPACSRRT